MSLGWRLHGQAKRIGVKAIPAIAACEAISVPVVVGVFRPIILLPAALMSGLSPDQLQALILHELAHIRRHDMLVNLLQRFVAVLLKRFIVIRHVHVPQSICP